jgi:lipopolysaccharide transport protein LptA
MSDPGEKRLATAEDGSSASSEADTQPAALSDLAELAGLADSLPALPVPSASVASEAAAALVPRKARATVTALAQTALPQLPKGPVREVGASLLQALPDSSESAIAGDPINEPTAGEEPRPTEPSSEVDLPAHETATTPQRLATPPAPDELAPQRANQSGSAFEVPAAAGDLLIAANSQTDFQMEEKRVVFNGDVIMKNERFYLTADRLVAYMKENQSGLEFAEAQGNVVVRMVENGRETGSSGLAKTAVYNPATGEIILKGWPQLRMGNKAHLASSATTEMSLYTDGRMKTSGRNQTMIVP